MNRYLLFAGANYYPSGGFHDFQGSYLSVEAALRALAQGRGDADWYHIVDIHSGEIVEEGRK